AHSPPPSALSPSFSTNDTRSNRGDDPAPPTNTPAPPPLPSVCTARFRVKTHCRTTTLAPSPYNPPPRFRGFSPSALPAVTVNPSRTVEGPAPLAVTTWYAFSAYVPSPSRSPESTVTF